jgi:hypothetical protein
MNRIPMPQHSHWYYILGWFLGVTEHNWPVMIALGMTGYSASRLYQFPTRRHIRRLYGWALLVFIYEYFKHLGAYLAKPVGFLFTTDWAWMQPAGYFIIERIIPLLILLVAIGLLLSSLRRSA